MKKASVRQLLFIEPLPLPLSSRAQPRDLQFRGPLLEMFFDGAERLTDLSGDTALDGAESKDPEGAYFPHAALGFSTILPWPVAPSTFSAAT